MNKNVAWKYPMTYDNKVEESKQGADLVPTIIDIGCGYGGLLFELSKEFPQKLILGMEIRDKVTNFVVEKINAKRINSQYKDYLNIAVVRTNTMKTIHNYFKKESVLFIFQGIRLKKCSFALQILILKSKTIEEELSSIQ